ncbi:Tll0287-like domain-containing protein [Oceanospirillum sp.]|uniref:Tll0287-like domain-containing protein n=1 Tax=Oceanospirillum sp. TaxID=2021254 RepID=UPI003A90E827
MKNTLTIPAMIVVLGSPLIAQAETQSPEHLKAEAKNVIQTLGKNLMGELKAAAQQGGLPAAIQVCNTKALPITDDVSGMKGWQISRTSLKLRNPQNAPDAWERQVLEQFATQAEQGADLKKLAYAEVITGDNGDKKMRLMKAIPVAEQCLACHGSNLKPEVGERLQVLYPHDNATGFKAGDLRGAFSLEKQL